jgi:CheY-like chemotaxis protein
VTRPRHTHLRRQASFPVPEPEAKTVLVVDDEPAVLLLVQRTLEAANYCVISAGNGHDALRIPESFRVDLVLA